jgi:hypothetical protein
MALYWPQGWKKKRIPSNLGGQFATLGANLQPQNAQSWPQDLMFNPNQAFLLVQKVEITPQGFTLGVKGEIEKKKKLFNLPKVTNKCCTLWALHWPKGWKKDTSNLGGKFATGGQYLSIY